MRKNVISLIISLMAIVTAEAQTHAISTPRFARPLVEKWIEEYSKLEPSVRFRLLNGCGCTEESELYILPYGKDASDSNVIIFAEYAILPFTAADSEAAGILGGRRFSTRRLRDIFFQHDMYQSEEELTKQEKRQRKLVVYSANNGASTTNSFAELLGENAGNLRGKRISGDDLFLTNAVSKDPLGVSFNTLSNLYDLKSRRLKDGLTIVQFDTKRELEDGLTDTATLDNVVELLEKYQTNEIPVGKLGLVYKGQNPEVQRFLSWILVYGRQHNHDYGLLEIDEQLARQQIDALSIQLTAQNR